MKNNTETKEFEAGGAGADVRFAYPDCYYERMIIFKAAECSGSAGGDNPNAGGAGSCGNYSLEQLAILTRT